MFKMGIATINHGSVQILCVRSRSSYVLLGFIRGKHYCRERKKKKLDGAGDNLVVCPCTAGL